MIHNEQIAHLIWEEALHYFPHASDAALDEFKHAVHRVLHEHVPRTFEIWRREQAYDSRKFAAFYGRWPGATFAEACKFWAESALSPYGRSHFDLFEGVPYYCGARLYPSEPEARA